jgi:oligopeptide/dipeptide ABC transporter ATP-binding protein
VETGPTDQILSAPNHPYVEVILAATPRLHRAEKPQVDSASAPWLEQSEQAIRGCVFEPRCKYAQVLCREKEPELIERARGHFAACHFPLNELKEN